MLGLRTGSRAPARTTTDEQTRCKAQMSFHLEEELQGGCYVLQLPVASVLAGAEGQPWVLGTADLVLGVSAIVQILSEVLICRHEGCFQTRHGCFNSHAWACFMP